MVPYLPYALPHFFNKMAKLLVAALLVWFVGFKQTMGIGYKPVKPHISNTSEDENITVYTVHQNETLRVSIKRISKEFEQILHKDGKQILGLDTSNKTVYVNDSGSDQGQLENIHKYFHMKILNESHVQIIIYCGTNFVEGNYSVQYNGVSLSDEPHPSRFSIKFAESPPSLRPSPSIFSPSLSSVSSTQRSQPSTRPSPSLAPSTQISTGPKNLSTQAPTITALSTSVNESTGTDDSEPHIWIAVGIGCTVIALALLVAFILVCKKRARSRTKSQDTSIELNNTV